MRKLRHPARDHGDTGKLRPLRRCPVVANNYDPQVYTASLRKLPPRSQRAKAAKLLHRSRAVTLRNSDLEAKALTLGNCDPQVDTVTLRKLRPQGGVVVLVLGLFRCLGERDALNNWAPDTSEIAAAKTDAPFRGYMDHGYMAAEIRRDCQNRRPVED